MKKKRGQNSFFDDDAFLCTARSREGLRDDANDARMIQREKRADEISIRAFLGFEYSFFSLRCSSSALFKRAGASAFFVFFFPLLFCTKNSLSDFRWERENFL
jgi:hypothetical protein